MFTALLLRPHAASIHILERLRVAVIKLRHAIYFRGRLVDVVVVVVDGVWHTRGPLVQGEIHIVKEKRAGQLDENTVLGLVQNC